MGENLGNQVKKGVFWTFGERIGSKVVQFLLQLLLARILVPEDYGLCALLLAFVNIATVLVNSGLNTALVQQKEPKHIDYSSVFYVSFALATLLYGILYISANEIALFFKDGRITLLLRVISITLLLGAFNSVQVAYLMKRMQFKKMFYGNFLGVLVSAFVSVYFALNGAGVWAIVIQYVANRIVVTLTLLFLVRWFPRFEFSIERIRILWNFGWKYMLSSFLSTIVTDIYTAVVGKCFTKQQLGAYDTGNKIPSTVSETFTTSLSTVLFPAFTTIQDDKKQLKQYVRKANRVSSFIMVPLMLAIAAMAEQIVTIVLTEKWIVAVPFLQMACILYALYPIHSANLQAINAIGRSDIALKLELQKKLVDLTFLALMIQFGIYWVAMGRVLTSFVALWINMRPNKAFLDYPFWEQVKDIAVTVFVSIIVAIIVYLFDLYTNLNVYITLVIQVILCLVSYCVMSYLFNKELLLFTLKTLIKRN